MIFGLQTAAWSVFLAKLLWNATVPWVLWSRRRGMPEGEEERRISMMLLVEFTLAPVLLLLAWVSPAPEWHGSVVWTAGLILIALLVMAILMVIAGVLGKLRYDNRLHPPAE